MRDAGVLGAALMAGVGIGAFPSLSDATRTFVQFDKTFVPVEAAASRHAERYESYNLAYEQLRPVNSRLRITPF